MTLGEKIVATLKAWPAFTVLAGQRAFPVNLPAATLPPLLIYTIVAGERAPTHDDATENPNTALKFTTVQFTALGATRGDANALLRATHEALHLAQTAAFSVSVAADARHSYEPAANLHRAEIDLTIGHSLPL